MNQSNVSTFFGNKIALFAFGVESIVENTCSLMVEVARNARAIWEKLFNWGNVSIDGCQNRSTWSQLIFNFR